ncbi:unnamed protein product [Cuscuta campestris]|uniref:No apical meristem-associated C-terminal domain-containing protein n=1 Tax=Cuscuta campestris TaxID=132261 RepID=A0A484N8Z1_9ASTE|nr:unnamed protein product [Cuscuta campestris]
MDPTRPLTPSSDPSLFSFTGPGQVPNMFQMQQWQHMQWQIYMQQQGMRPMLPQQLRHNVAGDIASLSQDDEGEVVPDTQPHKSTKGKGKKRNQEGTSGRSASKPWTATEEEALARAWVNISQDPIKGNAQTSDGFWNKVTHEFHVLMNSKPYRLFHSVSSKYRDMNKKIGWFASYYNKAHVNRPSGVSDDNVLKTALEKYQAKHGPFPHLKAWEVFNASSKWAPTPNEVPRAKRAKTSESGDHSPGGSDAHWMPNISDDADLDGDITPSEPQQPVGRDKAKKASSSKTEAPGGSKLDVLVSRMSAFHELQTEKLRLKQQEKVEAVAREEARLELERQRLVLEEFKVMTTDIESLPPRERAVLMKMKDKIAEKWLRDVGGSGSGDL